MTVNLVDTVIGIARIVYHLSPVLVAGAILALIEYYNDEITEMVFALYHWLVYRESFATARQIAKIDRKMAVVRNADTLAIMQAHLMANSIVSMRTNNDECD